MIPKIFWALRYLAYRFAFFNSFKGSVGYFGTPIYVSGLRRANFGYLLRVFPLARIEVQKNGCLKIGDNVSIGQQLHLTCGKYIEIGDNCIITRNVTITDILHTYPDKSKPRNNYDVELEPTIIGKNVFIGANAVIDRGSHIGDGSTVAANAYVRGNFPDNSIIYGSSPPSKNY
jgi:acetyltransferase-like isoleucine patch superfamily enzyme